jgi:hypothetical protein
METRTDAELPDDYASRCDGVALAGIVARHGAFVHPADITWNPAGGYSAYTAGSMLHVWRPEPQYTRQPAPCR